MAPEYKSEWMQVWVMILQGQWYLPLTGFSEKQNKQKWIGNINIKELKVPYALL